MRYALAQEAERFTLLTGLDTASYSFFSWFGFFADTGLDPNALVEVMGSSAEGLAAVLTGTVSDETTTVLSVTAEGNLLVYLVGHGGASGMPIAATTTAEGLDGEGSTFSPEILRSALCTLQDEGRLRRALVLIESCYSGVFGGDDGLGAGCEPDATPLAGTVLVTAANAVEVSYAGEYDGEVKSWVNDQFSRQLAASAEARPGIDLLDLYLGVYQEVPGSHTSLFTNADSGRLSTVPLTEFTAP